jgi:chromosomal replication initiation ATPase DnaA
MTLPPPPVLPKERLLGSNLETCVKRAVATAHNMTVTELLRRTTVVEVCIPRQLAMWLLVAVCDNGLMDTSMAFRRNVPTVQHACKQVMAMRDTDKHFRDSLRLWVIWARQLSGENRKQYKPMVW